MGNSPSLYSASFQTFINNFEFFKNEYDKYKVDCTVYQKKANRQDFILLVNKVFDRTDHFELSLQTADHFISYNHINLCNILEHSEKSEFQCLNQNFIHSIAIEYPVNSLQELIIKNKSSLRKSQMAEQTYLNESHSWYVLKSLVSVSDYMYKSGLYVGDISPKNVLIDQEGEVKLLNFYMVSDFKTSLDFSREHSGYRTTFPPEYLSKLKVLDWSTEDIDKKKADVFSIGMTLLCATSNEYAESFYDWSNYSVKFDKVVKKINLLKSQNFSSDFTNLLVRMLDPEFKKRPTFVELSYLIEQRINPGRKRGISTVLGMINRM